jgi:3,4-dihydroxy-2-butanone 4-phosphate synthase
MQKAHHDREAIARVTQALKDIRRGKMVILTDDEDRENEGDLVMAAEKVSPQAINFMAKHGRGLICLSLTEERLKQLHLPLMVTDNSSSFGTAFTVSVEAAHGVTTGISAADRAHTIKVCVSKNAKPTDLVRPGHIFPLRAREGGVLVRTGQTEGSVDLARMAGLFPAGVICEVMNDDGTMARRSELQRFAKRHGLTLLSVADIITYRLAHERLVRRVATELHRARVQERRRPRGSHRAGEGRRRHERAGAGAHAPRVGARRPARPLEHSGRARGDLQRGPRRAGVPAQARGSVRGAGATACYGHVARARRRRADPQRPGVVEASADHLGAEEDRRPRQLRPHGGGTGEAR